MNAWLGWALAVAAVAVGFATYGWPGVALAVSVVVFWLLLQFSRAMRAMRAAAGRPVGTVDSAVMLNSRLKTGMTLIQLLPMTASLGQKDDAAGPDAETYVWRDAGGDAVRVELRDGKVTRWDLQRGG